MSALPYAQGALAATQRRSHLANPYRDRLGPGDKREALERWEQWERGFRDSTAALARRALEQLDTHSVPDGPDAGRRSITTQSAL